jgi:transposase
MAAGKTVMTLPKANRRALRTIGRHLYKARHVIEKFFAKLKRFRLSLPLR